MTTLLRCENISKFYEEGEQQVQVLKNVSFSMEKGELVAIVGSSGSGKSTLLHSLGGLDQPSAGEVWIADQSLPKCHDADVNRASEQKRSGRSC